MPTTCAFNSDPIATPAANKVTLTGGGRPDRQPGRQEGVTGPRVLPPRLLGADTFPVTREAFYCRSSKCSPNPVGNPVADVFAAPAARRLRDRGACGTLGAWAPVPVEVACPLSPTRDEGVGNEELSPGIASVPGQGAQCPQLGCPGGKQPYSFPSRALGSGPRPRSSSPWLGWEGEAGAGAFPLQDTAWPLQQYSQLQRSQITTLGQAQRDNPGGGQSYPAPPSLGAGRAQPGWQAPASKLLSPSLGC